MKSLPILIKLAAQKVLSQRAILAQYEKKAQDIKQAIAGLHSELRYEAERASKDTYLSSLYGQYAQGIEKHIRQYQEEMELNEKRLLREKERLTRLYKDQKVLEIYQERLEQRLEFAYNQAEQKNLDEIAARLVAHQKANS